jgi:hypothetical protein
MAAVYSSPHSVATTADSPPPKLLDCLRHALRAKLRMGSPRSGNPSVGGSFADGFSLREERILLSFRVFCGHSER